MSAHKRKLSPRMARQEADSPRELVTTAISQHENGLSYLMAEHKSRREIVDLLTRIAVSFQHPFDDVMPEGMTRRTFDGLIDRLSTTAGEIEKLNRDRIWNPLRLYPSLVRLRQGQPDQGLYLWFALSNIPKTLRIYAGLIKALRKYVGKMRMGPYKGHLPREYYIERLFEGVKQPLRLKQYGAIAALLNGLIPGPHEVADKLLYSEKRLRSIHDRVLQSPSKF